MKKKQDLTDIENLLRIVENDRSDKVLTVTNPIASFINYYNITDGASPVPIRDIFRVYKHYTKNNKANAVTFIREFKLYFPNAKTRNHFKINTEAYNTISRIAISLGGDAPVRKYAQDSLKNFIQYNQISQGTFWVEDYILLHWFVDWRNKEKAMTMEVFEKLAKLYFEYKNVGMDLYFGINPESSSYLTPSRLQALRRRKLTSESQKANKKKSR